MNITINKMNYLSGKVEATFWQSRQDSWRSHGHWLIPFWNDCHTFAFPLTKFVTMLRSTVI